MEWYRGLSGLKPNIRDEIESKLKIKWVYKIIMIKFSLNKNSISSYSIIFYKVDLTLINY